MRKTGLSHRILIAVCLLLIFLFLVVAFIGDGLLAWFTKTLGSVGIESVIYTLKSPLRGTDSNIVRAVLVSCIPSIAAVVIIMLSLVFLVKFGRVFTADFVFTLGRKRNKQIRLPAISVMIGLAFITSLLGAVIVIRKIDNRLSISDYFNNLKNSTYIYDDYYVYPDSVQISCDAPKNLIYIYVESMESSFADIESGGLQEGVNYIPNLTALAQENISFSDSEKLGGFRCLPGCDWTIAGMFSSQSGIPFAFPVVENEDFTTREYFAQGTTMLGDILSDYGYTQEFLCGSDATFGGRRIMMEQHGGFAIRDVYYALEQGYISEAYGWGFLDCTLFDIAKDRLTELASQDAPFNLTMLTIDTHFPDGYTCDYCHNDYPLQFANVVSCSDRQVADFVEWCSEQPWYEDTVIVIQGDHLFMGADLSGGSSPSERSVYNCFINADKTGFERYNRCFTHFDMFPTVLSAMGFEIEGHRLGLGTDMFSDRPTLCEELGYDYLYTELSRSSRFYENFY